MATAAGTLGTDAAFDFDLASGSNFFGGGALVWSYWHFAPWMQPEDTWWKMHGVLASSAGVKGFPVFSCSLWFPFRWRFCSSLLCSGFRRGRSSKCSSNSRWCCWRGFRRHGRCSSFRGNWLLWAFEQKSKTKTLANAPKDDQNLSYWNFLGISWFHQWPFQAYEQREAYGTKTHQASSYWANGIERFHDLAWKLLNDNSIWKTLWEVKRAPRWRSRSKWREIICRMALPRGAVASRVQPAVASRVQPSM